MSWIVGGAAVARLGLERPSPARPIPAPAQTLRKAERVITPLHNLSDASEIAMRRRRSPDSMFYASSASARSKRNVVKAIPGAAFSLARLATQATPTFVRRLHRQHRAGEGQRVRPHLGTPAPWYRIDVPASAAPRAPPRTPGSTPSLISSAARECSASDGKRGWPGPLERSKAPAEAGPSRGRVAAEQPSRAHRGPVRRAVRARRATHRGLVARLLARKRATEADIRLPQTGHCSMPTSKHVSQSRHRATRPNGRWYVLAVARPFVPFMPLGRPGRSVGYATNPRAPAEAARHGRPAAPDEDGTPPARRRG